jgi:hypothetical protein
MTLPDPRDINQEMLNAMPKEMMARILFLYDLGTTQVLFDGLTENEGINVLMTAVAYLSEDRPTLDLPQAFGYNPLVANND